jgi:hypothetical protein
MKFDVAGPFKIDRFTKMRIITRQSKASLRAELEKWDEGLSEACGCYVFGVRAGKGIRPFYAGQSLRRSILEEAMNSSNINKYNEVLGNRGGGSPVLFVLPWLTASRERYRKKGKGKHGSRTLDFLEDWLIGTALQKNPKLINNKQTRFLRQVHVTGVFNAKHGEATWESGKFNAMMGT